MTSGVLCVLVAIPSIIVIFGAFVMWPIIRRWRGYYSDRDRRILDWLEHEIITRPAHGMERRDITIALLIHAGRDPQQVAETRQETFLHDSVPES